MTKPQPSPLKDPAPASYVFPLASVELQQDTSDLAGLRDIVGSARIIALGEATHGTKEFFQLKHRIIAFLASERKDMVFAIEANMPEAQRLNDFILHGQGDPKSLLEGMLFWTWNTQEVLDMILWMREYNLSGQGVIQFTGFDMQFPDAAAQTVLAFLHAYDPICETLAQECYTKLLPIFLDRFRTDSISVENHVVWSAFQAETKRIVEALEAQREKYGQWCSLEQIEWVIQQARVSSQAAGLRLEPGTHRDQCMAANVVWLTQRYPQATLVLWSHNIHIMRTPSRMGGLLARQFADDYCPIGFSFYAGTYVAVRRGQGPVVNIAQPALEQSIEAIFHRFGHSPLLFDLRVTTPHSSGAWLAPKRPTRNIGGFAVDGSDAYALAILPELYTAIIHVDQSTPSCLLSAPEVEE